MPYFEVNLNSQTGCLMHAEPIRNAHRQRARFRWKTIEILTDTRVKSTRTSPKGYNTSRCAQINEVFRWKKPILNQLFMFGIDLVGFRNLDY